MGFIEAKSDTSLFIYQHGPHRAYLLLYVDDIILTASTPALLRQTITSLQQVFWWKILVHFSISCGSASLVRPLACCFLSASTHLRYWSVSTWLVARPATPPSIHSPSCLRLVTLWPILPFTAVWLVPFSTWHLLVLTSLMLFNKFASTCTILGNRILVSWSASFAIFRGLLILGSSLTVPPRQPPSPSTLMQTGLVALTLVAPPLVLLPFLVPVSFLGPASVSRLCQAPVLRLNTAPVNGVAEASWLRQLLTQSWACLHGCGTRIAILKACFFNNLPSELKGK
jgi:hypothetical protein